MVPVAKSVEVLNEFPTGLCGRIKPIALVYLLGNILANRAYIFLARRSSTSWSKYS